MDRSEAYKLISVQLENWRQRPYSELVQAVGEPATRYPVWFGNAPVDIEVLVRWTDSKKRAVRIWATAYGPSTWRIEQIEESVIVHASLKASP